MDGFVYELGLTDAGLSLIQVHEFIPGVIITIVICLSALDRMNTEQLPRSPLSKSYGNLRPRDPPPSRPLAATKSASNSRTSVRSSKRRAPPPPRSGSRLVYVPGHYEEVKDDDPSLTFDDPRVYDHSHDYRPSRTPVGTPSRTPVGTPVGTPRDLSPTSSPPRSRSHSNPNIGRRLTPSRSNGSIKDRKRKKEKPFYYNPYYVERPKVAPKPNLSSINRTPSAPGKDVLDGMAPNEPCQDCNKRKYSDGSIDSPNGSDGDFGPPDVGNQMDFDAFENDEW